MGENPKYVFTVGNTSIDGIKKIKSIPKKNLEKKYGLDLSKPLVVILQHTVTSEMKTIEKNILHTINAVKELDIQSIMIYGNADAGSQQIIKAIKNSKIKQYQTIPYQDYINLLRYASVLIGNSSSGIIEAPFLHKPSINIGTRQDGRLRSDSIIDVPYDKIKIKKAIKKSIEDVNFKKRVRFCKNMNGNGNAAKKIIKILERMDLKKIPIQKKMTY